MDKVLGNLKKTKSLYGIAIAIFGVFLVFWLIIARKGLQGESDTAEIFSALYGIMALYGGLVGLRVSKIWGGRKSLLGRAILLASLGLLAQEIGQITYSAYTYVFNTEIPYPSLGDIGFFGSVILYIFAVINLIKALSTKASLKSKTNKVWIVLIPSLLLLFSYYYLLRGYEFDWNYPMTVILDFGYPLGQAFYIALAILAYVLSKKYLGGLMKKVILFLLFALVIQYIADFSFLYRVNRDLWKTAGINEFAYLVSYLVMTLSLIKFRAAYQKLSNSGHTDKIQTTDVDTNGGSVNE